MEVKDHRMSQGSIKERKLEPLSQNQNSFGNTISQGSTKAFTRVRGPINSVSNHILIKQMQASNKKLERIENRIRSLEQEQS